MIAVCAPIWFTHGFYSSEILIFGDMNLLDE